MTSFDWIRSFRVVRLLNTSSSSTNQNVAHRIRIQYFDRRKPQDLIGKRDVTSKILSYKPFEPTHDDEMNRTTSSRTATTTNTTTTNILPSETRKWQTNCIVSLWNLFFFRRSISHYYSSHSWCSLCFCTYLTNCTRHGNYSSNTYTRLLTYDNQC